MNNCKITKERSDVNIINFISAVSLFVNMVWLINIFKQEWQFYIGLPITDTTRPQCYDKGRYFPEEVPFTTE